MKIKMGQCKDCMFAAFIERVGSAEYECRIRSPRAEVNEIWGIWPRVLGSDWCGEYKSSEIEIVNMPED